MKTSGKVKLYIFDAARRRKENDERVVLLYQNPEMAENWYEGCAFWASDIAKKTIVSRMIRDSPSSLPRSEEILLVEA